MDKEMNKEIFYMEGSYFNKTEIRLVQTEPTFISIWFNSGKFEKLNIIYPDNITKNQALEKFMGTINNTDRTFAWLWIPKDCKILRKYSR